MRILAPLREKVGRRAHFDDGSSLYRSGIWRHNNGHSIANKQKEYLEKMAGQSPENSLIKRDLQNWLKTVVKTSMSWEANGIHIDEFSEFKHIARKDWLSKSLLSFRLLISELDWPEELVPFLHISLAEESTEIAVPEVSITWLHDNLNEFTPPSMHFSSTEYFGTFYDKNCVRCSIDESVTQLVNHSPGLQFFYRTYFDERERLYLREIYIFYFRAEDN